MKRTIVIALLILPTLGLASNVGEILKLPKTYVMVNNELVSLSKVKLYDGAKAALYRVDMEVNDVFINAGTSELVCEKLATKLLPDMTFAYYTNKYDIYPTDFKIVAEAGKYCTNICLDKGHTWGPCAGTNKAIVVSIGKKNLKAVSHTDGSSVLILSSDGTITVFNTDTLEKVANMESNNASIYCYIRYKHELTDFSLNKDCDCPEPITIDPMPVKF